MVPSYLCDHRVDISDLCDEGPYLLDLRKAILSLFEHQGSSRELQRAGAYVSNSVPLSQTEPKHRTQRRRPKSISIELSHDFTIRLEMVSILQPQGAWDK